MSAPECTCFECADPDCPDGDGDEFYPEHTHQCAFCVARQAEFDALRPLLDASWERGVAEAQRIQQEKEEALRPLYAAHRLAVEAALRPFRDRLEKHRKAVEEEQAAILSTKGFPPREVPPYYILTS